MVIKNNNNEKILSYSTQHLLYYYSHQHPTTLEIYRLTTQREYLFSDQDKLGESLRNEW